MPYRFEIDVSIDADSEAQAARLASTMGDRLGMEEGVRWHGSYRAAEDLDPPPAV